MQALPIVSIELYNMHRRRSEWWRRCSLTVELYCRPDSFSYKRRLAVYNQRAFFCTQARKSYKQRFFACKLAGFSCKQRLSVYNQQSFACMQARKFYKQCFFACKLAGFSYKQRLSVYNQQSLAYQQRRKSCKKSLLADRKTCLPSRNGTFHHYQPITSGFPENLAHRH